MPVTEEFLDRLGFEPFASQAAVLGVEVVDHDREMAVAVAERVGARAAVIDGELNLEIGPPDCAGRPG